MLKQTKCKWDLNSYLNRKKSGKDWVVRPVHLVLPLWDQIILKRKNKKEWKKEVGSIYGIIIERGKI